tara:strand:- start:2283 stop:2603 length:321 start_codon:yes stop_codon:yes gene_type:complete
MGYRSQVALALCSEADELLKANAKWIPELAELIKDNESDAPERYFWSSIKWYDSFKEIDVMNRFLEFLEHHDYQFGFIRLGEEEEDIQRMGYPSEYDMWVNRCIEW